MTRGQRDNSLWGIVRKGRLTASNFGAVIRSINSGRQPAKSLLKTLLGEYNLSGLKAIQWGCTHESTATKAYAQHTGTMVTPSGIWLSETGCLGASPDGLVGSDKILEIKCPFSLRNESVFAKISDDKFFLGLDAEGACCLNQNSPSGFLYYHQVQGNLYLTGRRECDFCVWTPVDMVIVSVKQDTEWSVNASKLEQFYAQHYLPAFLAGGVTK